MRAHTLLSTLYSAQLAFARTRRGMPYRPSPPPVSPPPARRSCAGTRLGGPAGASCALKPEQKPASSPEPGPETQTIPWSGRVPAAPYMPWWCSPCRGAGLAILPPRPVHARIPPSVQNKSHQRHGATSSRSRQGLSHGNTLSLSRHRLVSVMAPPCFSHGVTMSHSRRH